MGNLSSKSAYNSVQFEMGTTCKMCGQGYLWAKTKRRHHCRTCGSTVCGKCFIHRNCASCDLLFPRKLETVSNVNGFTFGIMQFNMLADGLSGSRNKEPTSKTFLRVPKETLSWNYRGPLIVWEIVRFHPDVVCVEECDHFETLKSELQEYNYDGVFHAKEWSPIDEINYDKKENYPFDGQAIFWRRNKFKLIGSPLHFQQQDEKLKLRSALYEKSDVKLDICYKPNRDDVAKVIESIEEQNRFREEWNNDDENNISISLIESLFDREFLRNKVIQRMLTSLQLDINTTQVPKSQFIDWLCQMKSPSGIAAVLDPITSNVNCKLVVLCTHLKSTKSLQGEKIRLEEAETLLTHPDLQNLLSNDRTSLFIAMDMNASPDESAGYPPYTYRYLIGDADTEEKSSASPSSVIVPKNDIKLNSGYRDCMGFGDREPPYTTWKTRAKKGKEHESKHTLDYIFYEQSKWIGSSFLTIPVEIQIQRERSNNFNNVNDHELPSPLPSLKYPSDHFAIMNKFTIDQ